MENTDKARYLLAKKRVEEIKKFYKHLAFYLVVNLFFIGRRIFKDIDRGASFEEAFMDVDNYHFFFWWGVFLAFHAVKVFGILKLFSKDWEDRKIKEYMK